MYLFIQYNILERNQQAETPVLGSRLQIDAVLGGL